MRALLKPIVCEGLLKDIEEERSTKETNEQLDILLSILKTIFFFF